MPDLPTFAVDDGFSYIVPDDMSGIEIGSIVRVPLGSRTVRGFVTSLRASPQVVDLRPIKKRSGELTVFDERLLRTARWAATHYVAPLSTVLAATAPPNLPRANSREVPQRRFEAGPVPARVRPTYHVTGRDYADLIEQRAQIHLAAGGNVFVVVPTAAECFALAKQLEAVFGGGVMTATSAMPAKDATATWSALRQRGGIIAVGTRELALWHGGPLTLACVVEEGRPAMKARQTPTLHVRDVMRRRSSVERFSLVFLGPVPTVEAVAAGVEIAEHAGRVWPFVEVADRNEEPPGSGVILDKTRAAVGAIAERERRVFVLAPHRGYAPAFACVTCGEVRRCDGCGAAVRQSGPCVRCGRPVAEACSCTSRRYRPLGAGVGRVIEELRRSLGDRVGEAAGSQVRVGTERDLVEVSGVDLAVAIDLDGRILAPTYRAEEDALRLGARLALSLARGRGRRCLVQTSLPTHDVIKTLQSGHPIATLQRDLDRRTERLLPPVGEVIAIELRGEGSADDDAAIRQAAVGATVRGPAPVDEGSRWLLQRGDLSDARIRLRQVVRMLRDRGRTVRIDADPIDL